MPPRTFGKGCPLGVVQVPLHAAQHAVQHQGLPGIHGRIRPALPELRLGQHVGHQAIGALYGAQQAAQEPGQPGRDVERAALGGFQLVVVVLAFALDLRAQRCRSAGRCLRRGSGPYRPRRG